MFVIQNKSSESNTLIPEEKPATKKRLSVKVIKKLQYYISLIKL